MHFGDLRGLLRYESLMTEICCRDSKALISLLVNVDRIARWRREYPSCCGVERRVVTCARCNTIETANAARGRERICRRGRVVVVADCSAVECDHCCGQRPTRDLHCLMTSAKATRRPCTNVESHPVRLLHSPTHTVTHAQSPVLCGIANC